MSQFITLVFLWPTRLIHMDNVAKSFSDIGKIHLRRQRELTNVLRKFYFDFDLYF